MKLIKSYLLIFEVYLISYSYKSGSMLQKLRRKQIYTALDVWGRENKQISRTSRQDLDREV